MKKWLLLTVVLASMVLLASAAVTRRVRGPQGDSGHSERPSGERPDVEALTQRLKRLEAAERQRGTELARQATSKVVAGERIAREKRVEEWMRTHYTPQVENKVFQSYFTELDRVRASEGVDPPWAQKIESRLGDVVRAQKAALREVSCGRTLCRVGVQFPAAADRERGVHNLLMSLGPELPEASVHAPVGSREATLYFARAGHALPDLDFVEEIERVM